jgi:hypothetical protein
MMPTAIRSAIGQSTMSSDVAAARLRAGRGEEVADGARGAALAADHFAEIGGIDVELDHGLLIALVGARPHLVGMVDEGLREKFDQLSHAACAGRSPRPLIWAAS